MIVMRNILCIVLALASFLAQAESKVIKLPADTKLVVFPFDPNNTYTILVRPGTVTDIQLGSDEQFSSLALGDNINFTAAKPKTGGHVFIRAMLPDQETSGTLITSMRAYQITLRSTAKGAWYQRVSWSYPDIIVMENGAATIQADASQQPYGPVAAAQQAPASPELPHDFNFEYQIEGEADFKPLRVYDDGRFTFINFSPKLQQLPAFFALDSSGDPEVVPYIPFDGTIKVQRLFTTGVLRLNNQSVRIVNLAMERSRGNNPAKWWQ